MTEVRTIPVPDGWSVEQAWEAVRHGDKLPDDTFTWANIVVEDGRFVKVVR